MAKRDERFEETFRLLFPRAYRTAFRILGNRGSAEDVAAEALARAYADWGNVSKFGNLDGRVLRVAVNLAIDVVRRKRPEPDRPESFDVEEAATTRAALGAALRSLPRRQREIVALRYLAGLSESEIADALGVSAGTVKSHTHRGIASLRVHLTEGRGEHCCLTTMFPRPHTPRRRS